MANLPWKIEPHDSYVCEDDTVLPIQIVDDRGDVVADNVQFYPTAITADRAELIVHCVNAHDDLLAGLRAIVERADNGELGSSKVQDMRRLANDMLAKHGGA